MKIREIQKIVEEVAWVIDLGDWVVTPYCCVRLPGSHKKLQIKEDNLLRHPEPNKEKIREAIDTWLNRNPKEKMDRLDLVWKITRKLKVELFRSKRGFIGLDTRFTKIFPPRSHFFCDPERPSQSPITVKYSDLGWVGVIATVRMELYEHLLPELKFV